MSSVVVYSSPGCVQCEWTVRKLTERGVPTTVVDLSTNAQAMSMVKAMGFSSAPVVTDGRRWWSGFDLQKIRELAPSTPTAAAPPT